MVVRAELDKLGINYQSVNVGEAILIDELTILQKELWKTALEKAGLILLDNKKGVLVEHIKKLIIDAIHYSEDQLKVNLSDFLSEKLGYDYTYLANLFSETKGITIEQFFITHRIECVKDLLVFDELNLTEIARTLHFSSVGHLSNQFKKVTGLTPSLFKQIKNN